MMTAIGSMVSVDAYVVEVVDSPKADCSNHGYNVFEHYTPREPISTRRYRQDSKYTIYS